MRSYRFNVVHHFKKSLFGWSRRNNVSKYVPNGIPTAHFLLPSVWCFCVVLPSSTYAYPPPPALPARVHARIRETYSIVQSVLVRRADITTFTIVTATINNAQQDGLIASVDDFWTMKSMYLITIEVTLLIPFLLRLLLLGWPITAAAMLVVFLSWIDRAPLLRSLFSAHTTREVLVMTGIPSSRKAEERNQ